MARLAVIFQGHALDTFARRALEKLRRDLHGYADVTVLGMADRAVCEPGRVLFDREQLLALPYRAKTAKSPSGRWRLIPGNTDLILLSFWMAQPDYDYYWVIEYDVRYTGNWRRLFEEFESSSADLLATNVSHYADIPDWNLWPTVVAPEGVDWKPHGVRAFLPICRVSLAACRVMDTAYRAGWGGHDEATWATIGNMQGLRIEDIGGDGPFTPPARRGRHYTSTPSEFDLTPGSFGYRPMRFFAPPLPGRLWHPVKPRQAYWHYRSRLLAWGRRLFR